MTIEELGELWFAEVKENRKSSTYQKYVSIYQKHIKNPLGSLAIREINSDIVAKSLPRQMSQSTNKSIYCVLNQILRYGICNFGMSVVPLKQYSVVGPARPVETMCQGDQQKMIHYLYSDMDTYKLGVVICLNLGLRLGEICALKWEDIDFRNKTLRVCRTVQRCFLQALFGQNCKIFLDIVAKRFWTLLHVQIGQSCNAPAGCVINQP